MTTTTYVQLTEAEVQRYGDLRSQALQGQISWWSIYADLADLLATEYSVAPTNSALLWLRGATEANAGRGTFSELIRSYTEMQYQLRYGTSIPAGKMQEASDAVADNLLSDILGLNAGWPRGQVPDINRISEADATAVGEILFSADLGHDENDTAYLFNSAWSGTLLFSLLGSPQTDRLLSTGNATSLDTLNDWRDVLYAAVAYRKAMVSAAATWVGQGPVQQGIDTGILGPTLVGQIVSGTPLLDLWKTATQGATGAVGQAFALIDQIGPEKLLDLLMGARNATVRIGSTTPSNFNTRANQFFNTFSASELQSLTTTWLPSSADGLAALAMQNTAEGLNARAALVALSPIVLTVNPAMALALTLFDPNTGTGNLSQQWIEDRAAFTMAHLQKLQGAGGIVSGAQNIRYFDAANNVEVLVGAGSSHRIQVLFGGGGGEGLNGQGFADRLYGGDGDDTLNAQGGHDHLEGNAGADTLDGGAGNDTLLGGAGIDQLLGEAGNDLLKGEAGNDVYVIDGSAGNDTIVDSDGGLILYQSHQLVGGNQTSPGAQEWKDEHVTYRVIDEGAKQHLLIIAGAGTLTIRDWTPGHFGIQLQGHEAPTPVEPQKLFAGDLAPVDQNAQAEGVQVGYDALGNVIVHANQAAPNRADVLYDSAADDELRGHGGDDTLDAIRGGNDLLDGGTGSDYLRAGEGDDTLVGGEGLDRLLGQAGDDRLFAEIEQSDVEVVADHEEATEDDNNLVGQGELLSGGADGDWQVGGQRADLLYGGEGKDTLWGGAGDDVLFCGLGAGPIICGEGNNVLLSSVNAMSHSIDWTPTSDIRARTRRACLNTHLNLEATAA